MPARLHHGQSDPPHTVSVAEGPEETTVQCGVVNVSITGGQAGRGRSETEKVLPTLRCYASSGADLEWTAISTLSLCASLENLESQREDRRREDEAKGEITQRHVRF